MRQVLTAVFTAMLVLAVSSTAFAQTTFTNADVLKLHAAGFTEDEIVAAINAADTKSFDTGTDALIALRTAGIGSKVMSVILGGSAPAPTGTTGNNDGVGSKVANGVRGVLGWRPFGNRNNDDEAEAAPTTEARDGVPATFMVNMTPAEACAAVRSYFIREGMTLEQGNCESGQLVTAWKRTSARWNISRKKEARTIVGFLGQGSGTEVQVSVRERSTITDNFSGDGEIKGELTLESLTGIRAAIR